MTLVFIQSLADYNAGRIVGEWVDVSEMDIDALWDAINKILSQSQEENAEEWEVAGYEGFYELTPTHPKTIIKVAETLAEHGEAYAIYALYVGENYATVEGFEDSYHGTWDSFLEFATEMFDECYLSELPEHLRYYIDYEAFARDLSMDYYHEQGEDGKVHIFRC